MSIIHVQSGSDQELQEIADTLGKSRKVIVITGAGISTNCGIPDFRSENGLYSMIQEQYDAALLNPPWEKTNTHDIDNRPKKKRKKWLYEVVAEDGKVVGVIDEDEEKPLQARPSSQSHSSNTTTTTSRSSTPSRVSDESSLSSCPSTAEEAEPEKRDESSCVTISPITTRPSSTLAPASQSEHSDVIANHSPLPNSLEQPVVAIVGTSIATEPPSRSLTGEELSTHTRSLSSRRNLNLESSSEIVEALAPTSDNVKASIKVQFPPTPHRPLAETLNTVFTQAEAPSSPLSPPPSVIVEVPLPSTSTSQSDISAKNPSEVSDLSIAEESTEAADTSQEALPSIHVTTDAKSRSSTPSETSNSQKPRARLRLINRKVSSTVPLKPEESNASTLPSSQASRPSLPNLKGRDLFDSMIWSDPFATSIFYMFISSLRQKVQDVSRTTESHRFLRVLRDGGRLVRNYTQNIDRLEEREGLSTDLRLGPGSKGRFRGARCSLPGGGSVDDQPQFRGCECVPLHGTLLRLRCQLCSKLANWDEESRITTTLSGSAPDCPSCSEYSAKRASSGRRGLGVGRLRPDIVLYGEENPADNLISPLITHDLSLGPDVLLIMGTSLKVHGLKNMVREFAKSVHAKNGKVIFVNNTEPSQSIWGDVLDYWVQWDCDEWVLDLKRRRADIWLPQGVKVEAKKAENRRDSAGITKSQRPSKRGYKPAAVRDDKINGVYLTFKILDQLRVVRDSEGRMADRFPYWPTGRSRNSTGPAVPKPRPKPKPKSNTTRPHKPVSSLMKLPTAGVKRKEPDPYLDDDTTVAASVAKMWERLREIAPSLAPMAPKYLRRPFSAMKSNMPSNIPPFAFNADCNHIPDAMSDWALSRINLVTHPPSGSTIPVHTPPKGERAVREQRAAKEERVITHGYGTRASGRQKPLNLDLTAAMDGDTIVVEENQSRKSSVSLASSPGMDSERIKRMGSIGNLVSSPEEWFDASEQVERGSVESR